MRMLLAWAEMTEGVRGQPPDSSRVRVVFVTFIPHRQTRRRLFLFTVASSTGMVWNGGMGSQSPFAMTRKGASQPDTVAASLPQLRVEKTYPIQALM